MVLRQKGQLRDAAHELTLVIAGNPGDAEARQHLGALLLQLDDVDGAIRELTESVRLDPSVSDARISLARALQKAGRTGQAQNELSATEEMLARQRKARQATILFELATQNVHKGDLTAALSQLREIDSLDPGFIEAQIQLATTLRQSRGDPAEIEKVLKRALLSHPDHPAAHHLLGLVLEEAGKKREASEEYRRAVELAPSLVEARRSLARWAMDSKDWAIAITEFRNITVWTPEDADAHFNLGLTLAEEKKWEEAASALRSAVNLKSNWAEAHYQLSIVLRSLGRTDESEHELRTARKLNPALNPPVSPNR